MQLSFGSLVTLLQAVLESVREPVLPQLPCTPSARVLCGLHLFERNCQKWMSLSERLVSSAEDILKVLRSQSCKDKPRSACNGCFPN